MALKQRKIKSLSELCTELSVDQEQPYVRTGIVSFDLLTKGRGLPMGSMLQFYSESGFGKSTTMLAVCRSLADQKRKSLYLAVEPNKQLAVDMGLFNTPFASYFNMLSLKTYSQLGEVTWSFLESDYTLMVIDSITACCVSKLAAGEAGIEDKLPAVDAQTRTMYLKVFNGNISSYKDKCIVYLNQTRSNFNAGWGEDDVVAEGGKASKFYSSIQFTMKGDARVPDITGGKDSKKVIGKIGYLRSDKNRFNLPLAHIPIEVIYGKGVSNIYSVLNYLYWKKYITSAGAFFTIDIGDGNPVKLRGRVERNKWVKEHIKPLTEDLYKNAEIYYEALSSGCKADV